MRKPFITFLLFLAMLSSPIHAHEHTAYSQESTLNYKNPDWIKNLRDDTRLNDLSMLGTHDSLGLYGDPILGKNSPAPLAITQTLPLSEQLNSGIRLFDIRLRMVKGGALVVHHGIVCQRANFDDVLSTMVQFLQAHPTEVVSMRIQKECLPTGTYPINTLIAQCVDEEDQPSFSDRLNSYFSKNQYKNYIFYENLRNPSLGQLRGKLVLIESNDSPGIKTDNFYTQFDKAHYGLTKSIDLYKKWEGIKEFLEAAKNRKNNLGYMTLLSGCGLFEGSYTDVIYPFFVASGHMLAGTNALNQTTGIRVAPTDRQQYPDFPREYCSDKECTIMYEGTNILTYQYIIENKPSYVGIVIADFPGPGLIDAVINSNSMNLIPGPYSHDKKVNSGNENASWMARLKDTASIGNLSVPGTHSSISLSGGDALQTQSMSRAA